MQLVESRIEQRRKTFNKLGGYGCGTLRSSIQPTDCHQIGGNTGQEILVLCTITILVYQRTYWIDEEK